MKSLISYFALSLFVLNSCTKDKVSLPPEPTKWEKIAGNYKVYDTLGMYLYDMELVHTYNVALNEDTLIYFNLHNQFNLFSRQPFIPPSSDPFRVKIGPEDPISDKYNKRWQLITYGQSDGCNIWKNDTIIMKFGLTNIKYWIEDATPYLDTIIKQVAVKQH